MTDRRRLYWLGLVALLTATVSSFVKSSYELSHSYFCDTVWCENSAPFFLLGLALVGVLFVYGIVGAVRADRRRDQLRDR